LDSTFRSLRESDRQLSLPRDRSSLSQDQS